MVNNSDADKIELTKEQILILQMSDMDIEAGKLISQEQLDKSALLWLKSMALILAKQRR